MIELFLEVEIGEGDAEAEVVFASAVVADVHTVFDFPAPPDALADAVALQGDFAQSRIVEEADIYADISEELVVEVGSIAFEGFVEIAGVLGDSARKVFVVEGEGPLLAVLDGHGEAVTRTGKVFGIKALFPLKGEPACGGDGGFGVGSCPVRLVGCNKWTALWVEVDVLVEVEAEKLAGAKVF